VRARIDIALKDTVLHALGGPLPVSQGEVVVVCVVDDVAAAAEAVRTLEAASTVRRKLRGKR
jgi:hypothetical protein